eukprot:193109_1
MKTTIDEHFQFSTDCTFIGYDSVKNIQFHMADETHQNVLKCLLQHNLQSFLDCKSFVIYLNPNEDVEETRLYAIVVDNCSSDEIRIQLFSRFQNDTWLKWEFDPTIIKKNNTFGSIWNCVVQSLNKKISQAHQEELDFAMEKQLMREYTQVMYDVWMKPFIDFMNQIKEINSNSQRKNHQESKNDETNQG